MPPSKPEEIQTQSETQVPNLLSLAFGQALKSARERKSGSAKDLASEFNCSKSHYLMTEGGNVILQPDRALRAVQIFSDFEFVPLVLFLVSAQILGKSQSLSEFRATAQDLKNVLPPQLGEVMERLRSVADDLRRENETGGDPDAREIVRERGLVRMLEDCLRIDLSAATIDDASIASPVKILGKELSRLSPVLFESVSALTRSLAGFQLQFKSIELYRFESAYADRFRKIVGVVRDPELFAVTPCVFDGENVNVGYRFLHRESFESFVVLMENGDPAEILSALIQNLKTAFNLKRSHYLTELELLDSSAAKIILVRPDFSSGSCTIARWRPDKKSGGYHVATEKHQLHEGAGYDNFFVRTLPNGVGGDTEKHFQHLWIYQTLDGNEIAFADAVSGKLPGYGPLTERFARIVRGDGVHGGGGDSHGDLLDYTKTMEKTQLIEFLLADLGLTSSADQNTL